MTNDTTSMPPPNHSHAHAVSILCGTELHWPVTEDNVFVNNLAGVVIWSEVAVSWTYDLLTAHHYISSTEQWPVLRAWSTWKHLHQRLTATWNQHISSAYLADQLHSLEKASEWRRQKYVISSADVPDWWLYMNKIKIKFHTTFQC